MLLDGKSVASGTMTYAGEVSTFEGTVVAPSAGTHVLRIVAADAKAINFAMFEKEIVVGPR